jgi:hypothetical protein
LVAELVVGVGHRELRATLEVYAQVQTPERNSHDPGDQQDARDREVQLPAVDEIYILEHAYLAFACCVAVMLAFETPIKAGER